MKSDKVALGIILFVLLCLVLGCGQSRYDNRVAEFRAHPAPQDATPYMGDSLIEFCEYNYPEFWTDGRVNRGIGGSNVWDVLSLWFDVVQNELPSNIFLMVGVNDMGNGEFYEHMDLLLSVIDVPVTTMSILPTSYEVNNISIADMNLSIQELSNLYELSYIDLWPFMVVDGILNPDYTTDGIHLNREGCIAFLDNTI